MRRHVWFALVLLCVLGLVAHAEVVRSTEDTLYPGADTWVSNDSQHGPDTNWGTEDRMRAWRHLADARVKIGFVRFDIRDISGDMSGATLTLAYTFMKGGVTTINVYGVNDGPNDFWIESGDGGLTYNNAPGLTTATAGNYTIETSEATLLGTFQSPAAATLPVSVTTDPATLDLEAFLEADTNGYVTFFFVGPNDEDEIATKENTTYDAPILTMPNASLGGALNPVPADRTDVSRELLTELSWDLIPDIASCDVYFGTDANTPDMDVLSFSPAVTTVDIDDFAHYATPLPDGTYYWRVDAYKAGDPNVIEGIMWSFSATSAPVYESITPEYQGQPVGGSAVITAVFTSSTTLDYEWYKSTDHTTQTLDDDVLVGGNSNVLTLTGLTAVDEASYYCKAINGGSTLSPVARVSVNRPLAQWNFEDNVADALGNYNGTLVNEPNVLFTAGMSGQAIDLAGGYVELPDGFDDFSAGLTFTVWARPASADNWARFLDLGNFDQSDPPVQVDNILFTRNGTSATLRLDTGNGTFDTANALTLNEWQFLVVTVDADHNAKVYKNGLQINSGTVSLPAIVTRTSNYIGESNWEGDALYAGLMDDLRVYNYAVDADTLATMYSDLAGTYCRVRPELDWNGNCIVDLADFATFVEDWLECGLWPVSACQ